MSSHQEACPWVCATSKKHHAKGSINLLSTIDTIDDKNIAWSSEHYLNLSWFNASTTNATSSEISEACSAWMDACGVIFREVPREQAFIIVRDATALEENSYASGTMAVAFFPDETPREIRIFRAFRRTNNNVGVLIHEIGHTLGFVHEHVWIKLMGEGELFVDKNGVEHKAKSLTEYDPQSIMHYEKLWDDMNHGKKSSLSPLDKVGAQIVYGLPAHLITRI